MDEQYISPYINTKMYTTLSLPPEALHNDLYQRLKDKLVRTYEKRCFRDYGYIVKIFKILECEEAPFIPEDPFVSGQFRLSFSCRMCIPVKKRLIVASISTIQELLIVAQNGPLYIYITIDRINDSVFFMDGNNRLRYRIDDKSSLLRPADFVKISVVSYTFDNRADRMKAIGFLHNIATNEEIEKYYEDLYSNAPTDDVVEFQTEDKEDPEKHELVKEDEDGDTED